VDHEDTRQFVEHELTSQHERDSERWGFDFLREKERSSGPGSKRYVWEKVTPHDKIPEPYALRGMKYLSKCAIHGDDASAPAAATTAVHGDDAPAPAAATTAVHSGDAPTQATTTTVAETKKTKQTSISGTALVAVLTFR
jgi:hypothetical protein